ncbi:MAG: flagellar hook-associated protein FlgK [Steroidobacteraceae bacterium]|jgi:flagellar hook-associated protein 1 FlgK
MGDMLTTGVSGLLAFQQALDTTSNNISNASTPGYNRELVNFVTQDSDVYGNGWMGNGVQVASIQRVFDETVASQVRSATSSYNQLNTFATDAAQIDDLLGSSSAGISTQLQNFSNAVQNVADSPTSTSARQALLSQATTLTSSMQGFDSSLQTLDTEANSSIGSEATTITSLAQSIASINQQIAAVTGQSQQQPPNDLLDQRDQLITELSSHINVTTSMQSDGTENIYIGSGQALVSGDKAATLVATPNTYDPAESDVSLQSDGGSVDITNNLTGGTLGGILQFRSQMIDPTRNALGQIAVTVANAVNQQNNAGMDQNGNLGGDVFAVGGVGVDPSTANTGNATVTVTRSDPNAITTANYQLSYSSSGWSMIRTDTGAAVALTPTGTAGTYTADGMTITIGAGANAGDSYLIQPTTNAVQGMSVLLTSPSQIAAASAVITSPASTNTGTGTISAGTVIDPGTYVAGTYTLGFTNGGADWQVTDAGGTVATGTYTSGADIDFNGMQVQVTGAPAATDTFAISPNSAGSSDNSNANAMAGLFDQLTLGGGTQSINGTVQQLVTNIGVQTDQAQTGATAQQTVLTDATNTQQSQSGVNLDEEAANLVQYQQAYEAAAQVIKTADNLFQSLIAAVGGTPLT